jgi:hypothetical protein
VGGIDFGLWNGLVVFKSRRGGITTATIKALTCFCLFVHRTKIQATRYAGGRWHYFIEELFRQDLQDFRDYFHGFLKKP